ncbi:MAG: hypothetical protein JST04_01125 [Bdellovibrionales bacterium]|nr:hypothetical protein [Bdellovibrionales bacterium]
MKMKAMLSFVFGLVCVQSALAYPLPQGTYREPSGAIYYSNGVGAYCSYANYSDYVKFARAHPDMPLQPIERMPRSMRYDGACQIGDVTSNPNPYPVPPTYLAQGFYRLPGGGIIYSNGVGAACGFYSWGHFLRHGGSSGNWIDIAGLPYGIRYDGYCAN